MNSRLVSWLISWLVFFLLQVVIFRDFVLFNVGFFYLYVFGIMLAPTSISLTALLLTAFGVGLLTDVFYSSLGLHTSALVTLAFLRGGILRILTPVGGYDDNFSISLSDVSVTWLASYAALCALVHHMVLFYVEAWGSGLFLITTSKILFSTLITVFIFIMYMYMLYAPKKR